MQITTHAQTVSIAAAGSTGQVNVDFIPVYEKVIIHGIDLCAFSQDRVTALLISGARNALFISPLGGADFRGSIFRLAIGAGMPAMLLCPPNDFGSASLDFGPDGVVMQQGGWRFSFQTLLNAAAVNIVDNEYVVTVKWSVLEDQRPLKETIVSIE